MYPISMASAPSPDEIISRFARTTAEIVSLDELRNALASKKKMVLKYGADVTATDLHIGHAVNLWMYRAMQEMGHKVVFLIGDFTTAIGDPTGRSKTRPLISEDEIAANSEEFIRQAKMVLIDDPAVLEIRRNSEWLRPMPASQLLSLMSLVTHEHLISRSMFRARIENGQPIYEHELIYPILQGYDSVALHSDMTIIGSDQLFNEMMGRTLQQHFGQHPQIILTTKITPGIDGKEKQSKSIGNYIGLRHTPRDKFGRVMSIPDALIGEYFLVYTDLSLAEIERIERSIPTAPMEAKLRLACAIVARYHGATVAEAELQWFRNTFSGRETPNDAPVVRVTAAGATAFSILRSCFRADEKSNSDLRRLFEQRAVRFDGHTVVAFDTPIAPSKDQHAVLVKVGKRNWFRVELI
jgi:tyrosyl-tRNA synthetase